VTYTTLCGRLGRLSALGGDPKDAHVCFLWQTDRQLWSARPGAPGLLEFACEVAELYHTREPLHLPKASVGGTRVGGAHQVIWLEVDVDDTLVVLLKPLQEA